MAIRMATLNAAVHFRLDHVLGSITPSRLADFMLVADLADPHPFAVYVDGRLVATDGRALFANDDTMPDWSRGTMHLAAGLSAALFASTVGWGSPTCGAHYLPRKRITL